MMNVINSTDSRDLDHEVTSGKPAIELYDQIKFEIERFFNKSSSEEANKGKNRIFLFSKPIIDKNSGEIDWIIDDNQSSEIIPYTDLNPIQKKELENKLSSDYQNITNLIEELNNSDNSDSINMSKAIQAALVIPSSDYIYSVGGQPVLTGWGHKKTGETSAPEILKLIAANNRKPNTQSTTNNQDPNQLNQVNSTKNMDIVYSSVLVSSYPYRIIQWFLWLIFFGILFFLFWLYLKHCSLNLPFQDKILLNYCQSNINKSYDPELNILQNKLNQLEQKIAENNKNPLSG